MLKIMIEQTGSTGSLVLEGEMIIEHAKEMKKTFLDALESGGPLNLDLEGVSKVDMFGLQVLCAAHLSALKSGKAMSLIGKQPEALRNAAAMAGYGCTTTCSADKTCPWNAK